MFQPSKIYLMAYPGTTIKLYAQEMVKLAKITGRKVYGSFNNIDVMATPDSKVNDITYQFRKVGGWAHWK